MVKWEIELLPFCVKAHLCAFVKITESHARKIQPTKGLTKFNKGLFVGNDGTRIERIRRAYADK
ncbi:hypothetical protein AWR27_19090 [Spirosoma montaniterrae]|uniref:Uncharacterized protein n=1 Tax=Spirosoma montaniterrae TaxID=1178516 RepID=A0A1P9X0T3_9BACT|nr:hypothetical protein AWR27_19090 [Spirosoma montaniterrae]